MDWTRKTLFANNKNTVGIRKKLAEAGGEERHAFVGVTFNSPWEANRVLRWEMQGMPPRSPELPEEVTHLWIIPAMMGERCLVWHPVEGWFDPVGQWATG